MTKKAIVSILAIAALTEVASAAVTISDVTFTDSLLSFTLSGTLDASRPSLLDRSFIIAASDPADDDWLQNPDSFSISASVNTLAVAGEAVSNYSAMDLWGTNVFYFQTQGGSFLTGDLVEGTFTATLPAGLVNLANLDSDLVLYWGSNSYPQLTGPAIGTLSTAAIPEPQAYAAVVSVVALGVVAFRRNRRR